MQTIRSTYGSIQNHGRLEGNWVLEAADIPSGLAFVQDKREKQHYLLTVTEQMTVYALAKKLAWVADRMSKITDARKAL